MVRFITYDILLGKIIGVDRNVKSAIDNIRGTCNEKENICVVHDINDCFNKNNQMYKNKPSNRYYIIPVQNENVLRVVFK